MSMYYNHKKNLPQNNQPNNNQQWQNIDHITNHINKQQSTNKSKPKDQNQNQSSQKKTRVKDKLSLIVNLIQEKQQVASVSQYHPNEQQDELDFSISTVQSNNRRKYKTFQRDSDQWQPKSKKKLKTKRVQEEDQLFFEQNKKKQKAKPKYLFYNLVKQQKQSNVKRQRKIIKKEIKRNEVSKDKDKQETFTLKDYNYEKGVHLQKEQPKDRLKNKLGCIFDLFHRNQEVASVSYYSQKQSHKQSMEITQPLKKEQQRPSDNIFNHDKNQIGQQFEPKHEVQLVKQQQISKSNQFEVINIPTIVKPESKQGELDIYSNIKKQIKGNKYNRQQLQKSFIDNSRINSRQRSKMSLAKSLETKPKNTRYEDLNEMKMKEAKKSIELSRNLSSNKASIKKESSRQEDRLSKSKSQNSNLSVKLMEVSITNPIKVQQNEASKPQQKQQLIIKKLNKQEEIEYEQATVKKMFPIARNIDNNKNNNLSKYMKINYKQSEQSKEDSINEQIPSIFIRNTNNISNISRTRPIDLKNNDLKQIQTNANTGQISIKPLNKIQFSLEKSKRLKSEVTEPKDNLTDQQRKFLNLLKKREEALLKRVKEQVTNNNPNTFLKDNSQERGRNISNNDFERLMSNQDSLMLKAPKNYLNTQRKDKMSLNTEFQGQLKQLPSLNSIPYAKQAKFQTFYHNNSPIKRTNSKNSNYIPMKGKKGFSEHLSSDSQKKTLQERLDDVKGFKRQPSKISYYQVKKLHNDLSLKDRVNLNSKEKYDRLKQLLQQI